MRSFSGYANYLLDGTSQRTRPRDLVSALWMELPAFALEGGGLPRCRYWRCNSARHFCRQAPAGLGRCAIAGRLRIRAVALFTPFTVAFLSPLSTPNVSPHLVSEQPICRQSRRSGSFSAWFGGSHFLVQSWRGSCRPPPMHSAHTTASCMPRSRFSRNIMMRVGWCAQRCFQHPTGLGLTRLGRFIA